MRTPSKSMFTDLSPACKPPGEGAPSDSAQAGGRLYTYSHARPAVSVDVIVFKLLDERLHVLLVRRGREPFAGAWAIPGGFVEIDESLEHAARRELAEETGLTDVWLEQLYTFGRPDRDPRGRVVTVAYYALAPADQSVKPVGGDDAAQARWFDVGDLPPLAFDHDEIVHYALQRLRTKLEYTTVGFQLLPTAFTLSQLQRVYEAILGRTLDKRNFRRKVVSLGILQPVGRRLRGGPHRPAGLYQLVATRFENLKDRGILFPF